MSEKLIEIVSVSLNESIRLWSWLVFSFVVFVLLGTLLVREGRVAQFLNGKPGRHVYRLVVLLILGVGLVHAVSQVSIYTDAYFSFRYAWNFAHGNGLVFNVGHYVEGYTNFLWTILIAGVIWTDVFNPEFASVVLCLLGFIVNLLVVIRIGRKLHGRSRFYLPVAAVVLCTQGVFTAFGTTGMETMFASLLVNTGLLFLLRGNRIRNAFGAGVFFILATLTRPDHSIFYITAGVVLFAGGIRSSLAGESSFLTSWKKRSLPNLIAYSVPFLGYLLYLAWKISYYGSILPNTYYAKSAGIPYYSQGTIYVAVFYLFNHMWIAAILLGFYLFFTSTGDDEQEFTFKAFVGVAFLLWNFYVLRIGGDYMVGRFYVVLLPILMLGAESFFYKMGERARSGQRGVQQAVALTVIGLIGLTAMDVKSSSVFPEKAFRWNLVDESISCAVDSQRLFTHWRPVEFDVDPLEKFLSENRVLIKGGFSYYSPVHYIDGHGLTDEYVANLPLRYPRGAVGHEKYATEEVLRTRGVRFSNSGQLSESATPDHPFPKMESIRLGNLGRFRILIYDRLLMKQIRDEGLDVEFADFELFLDQYLEKVQNGQACVDRSHVQWFQRFYFDHNSDVENWKRMISAYQKRPCLIE